MDGPCSPGKGRCAPSPRLSDVSWRNAPSPSSLTAWREPETDRLDPPEVVRVAAGPEAGRLDNVHGELEAVTHSLRQVRVAAERHRRSPHVTPPPDQVDGRQRRLRVDLEYPLGPGQRAQHGPVLLLEVFLPVQVRP